MSEPVEAMPNTVESKIPERLQNILNALAEYHRSLLQEYSLRTQNPNELLGIEAILSDRAKLIEYFILYGKLPSNIQLDERLQNCLSSLQKNIWPWNPETTVLSRYWCKLMFEEYPFTINHQHIENLYKKYVEKTENDGPEPDPNLEEEA